MLLVYDGNNYARKTFETDTTGLGIRRLFTDVYHNPTPSIVVFDGKNSKDKRREIYPGYKAQRPPAPDGFYRVLDFWKELLMHTHAVSIEVPGYEADDVIGKLADDATSPMTIWSTDRDYLAKCNEFVKVPQATLGDLPANEVRLYKTLVGDTTDNVKGLVGFGPKNWRLLSDQDKAHITAFLEGETPWPEIQIRDSLNLKAQQNAELLRAYWKVVGFLPIENSVIQSHMKIGSRNLALAESKLEGIHQGASSTGTKQVFGKSATGHFTM